ncbi:type VII secretion integral membrane protein EccD [Mycolicibacterium frederiksbergense]|uniref:type VII secretion integral membrane protein EccD n=1 Tax=Mycolicibacterium frederiksbergense TaxID=117567 RepID=UPI00143B992F|nr:type VII secretion integral membrane protein EccD [Mycolicibacterium frederiksbergense]
MSAVSERTGIRPAAQVRLREQVRVAVLFGDRQTDLVLPATEAVATVVNEVLAQVASAGDEVRSPDENDLITPGTVSLKRVGGAVLTRGQSLREQGITDGSLLILEVDDAEVSFTEVIENASSAIAHFNAQRFKSVTARTALTVASVTAATAAVIVSGLLFWVWILEQRAGAYWPLVPPAAAAGLAVVLLFGGAAAWWRQHVAVMAYGLWAGALTAIAVAGYTAVPGPAGAWHVVLAATLTMVAAIALWALSPAPAAVLAWLTLVCLGAALLGVLHAIGIEMHYLWVGALVVALILLKKVESLSGLLARVPMPNFPTVTGKLVFDDAEGIATEALVAAETEGTPSTKDLYRASEAANGYLQSIVAAVAPFFVLGAAGVVIPGQGRWILGTVFVLGIATILVLGGRALDDRAAAVTVVGTALAMTAALGLKYALSSDNPTVSLIIGGIIIAVGLSALAIAAIVPQRPFSAPFRKLLEWFEYLLLFLVFPVTVWLLNLYFLARTALS